MGKTAVILLLVLLALVAVWAKPSPPSMPLAFSTDMVWWLSASLRPPNGCTALGSWYYQQSPLISVHVYTNSSKQPFCSSTSRPQGRECRVYSNDEHRWVFFPDQRWCCHCCDASTCAGPLRPDWLVYSGGVYMFKETVDGIPCNVWGSQGGQWNLWYVDESSGAPVRYAEYMNGTSTSNTTYYNTTLCKPPSYFTVLPDYCRGKLSGCDGLCKAHRASKEKASSDFH